MSALADVAAPAPEPVRTTDSAALALDYADRLVLGAVRDIHQAVASRLLPASRFVGGGLPERVHSITSNALYTGLSTSIRGSASGLRALARRGVGAPLEASVSGRQLLSSINAMVGAELAEAGDPGAIRMALRAGAEDVPVDPVALAAAYPQASGRIVLFVHGLGENDESWQQPRDDTGLYPTRVAAETDWTPVVLRYNTGSRVSDNGAELAELIARLTSCWPVPVTSLAFVGHSMGGLLARSATVHALAGQHDWARHVTHVVCLGTPHLGAQWEKAVHLGSRALALMPASVPFAATRPVPLQRGCVTRNEWSGHDLTAKWGEDRLAVAPLAHAAYHFVAAARHQPAQLMGRAGDPAGSTQGADGSGPSAAPVDPPDAADHVALLRHPQVADWLVTWLQCSTDEPAGARTEEGVPPRADSPGRHRATV